MCARAPGVLVVLLLALMVAAPAGSASYPGAVRVPELEARLPLPFEVYATENTNLSFVCIGEPRIYLARWVVPLLLYGRPGDIDETRQMPWVAAVFTLYHEFWNLAFAEENEQNSDLGTVTILRYLLRRYWGLSAAEAQKQYQAIVGPIGAAAPLRTSPAPHLHRNAYRPLIGYAY